MHAGVAIGNMRNAHQSRRDGAMRHDVFLRLGLRPMADVLQREALVPVPVSLPVTRDVGGNDRTRRMKLSYTAAFSGQRGMLRKTEGNQILQQMTLDQQRASRASF